MSHLTAAVAFGLLAGALVAHAAPPPAGDEIARGHRLFDVHCARCHGIGGGGGEGPTLLRPLTATDEELLAVIRDGIPGTGMTGNRSLSPDDSARVAAYVRSLGEVTGEPVTGDAARGRELYDEQACGACHILAGEGRGIGPELTAIGRRRGVAHLRESLVAPEATVSEDYRVVTVRGADGATVRGVRVSEDDFAVIVRDADARLHTVVLEEGASVRREPGASLMPGYARRLSSDEIDALVAYLASLEGAP